MRLILTPLTAAARALLALARQCARGGPSTGSPVLPAHDPGAPAPLAEPTIVHDQSPAPAQEEIGTAIARRRTTLVTLMWAYHTTSTSSQMRRYSERTTAQYAFAATRTRTIGPFSLN